MRLEYKSFEEWFHEIEVFSLRSERAISDLGPDAEKWLRTAWALGEISNELSADGHAAEAAKDVRSAGWPEAAGVIAAVTLPESKKIIRQNIHKIARDAGLIPADTGADQ